MVLSSQKSHQCSDVEIYTDNLSEDDTPGPRLQLQRTRSSEALRTPAFRGTSLTLIFANADEVRHCATCRNVFTEVLRVPQLWWTPWARSSNGYFGCDETLNSHGDVDGYNTWFRYLIKMTQQNATKNDISFSWLKFNIYTRWEAITKHTFLVVFDPKPPVKEEILSSITIPERTANQPGDLEDPYWVHVQILQQVIRLQDAAVWAIRDLVRGVEMSRATVTETNGASLDYARHHEIARHAIHVSETAALSIKTTEHILVLHREFSDQLSFKSDEHWSKYSHSQIHKQLYFLEHMMHSLALRSTATRDRLLNEIQLAFNIVTQFDSHASVAIGRATQYDSYSMRSVAFLTLTFLPATFVSALFSMSFFSYDPESGWIVSEKIWLYFAIAGPLTGISLMLWLAWQKLFPPESVTPFLRGSKGPSWGENTAPHSKAATWETRKSRMDMQINELNTV